MKKEELKKEWEAFKRQGKDTTEDEESDWWLSKLEDYKQQLKKKIKRKSYWCAECYSRDVDLEDILNLII